MKTDLNDTMDEKFPTLTIEGAPMANKTVVQITKIPLNKLKLNRNSRLNIDPDELEGLMQSIKIEGLLQPIGVVKNGTGYEICYGNRRFLAVSKLGMKTIPVVIHEKKKESDVDIKNLTENVQRRNISIVEVGRYLSLLSKQGLTPAESAVRLGVSKSYVSACLDAFRDVPEEFRDDLEVRVGAMKDGKTRATAGKVSLKTARQTINAMKSRLISRSQMKVLLRAAKEDERFNPSKMPAYIDALSRGKEDFFDEVAETKQVRLMFQISKRHQASLEKEFVDDGPFKNINELFKAILKGEKSVAIKILR